ncbi:hypothetical protein [Nonomuraea sp. bgisy101]|uniref:hypothetical protein n=1 Tax=Nonomuraea sp. bgisy101 TaxID=3413784 RepID=UPI003D72E22C
MLTDMHAGALLRGLRHQRRLTLEELSGPQLSARRLMLIEDGVDPTARELAELAAKLGCPPLVLRHGLGSDRSAEIRQELAGADEALAQGMSAKARVRYATLAGDPALGSRPDLWRQTELGLALAEEADGDLPEAIERLTHLMNVLAPLDEQLPPMAYEDREETEHRIGVALALCRCLREVGDLTASVHIGEITFSRELPGGWTDRGIELGATLLAAYIERGEQATCRALAAQLLDAAEQLGTPRALRAACWNGATVAAMDGDAQRAGELGDRALAAHAQLSDPRSTGRLRARLAENLLTSCPAEHARARQMLLTAQSELAGSAASAVDLAYCQLSLARTDLLAGDPTAAARQAEEIAARHPAALNLVADAQLLTADTLRAREQTQAAAEVRAGVGEQLEQMQAPARASKAFADSAAELEQCGDLEASTRAYQRALSVGELSSL